ncbi:MAG: SusC/RagA family TonB-linked outer membrane protein [Cytophagales bacterium]|nr:SusC/RagA family TonB-linked outer membrane protein [Cytophagales bacterium]
MKKLFTLSTVCLMLVSTVFAQNVTITGTVTDQNSGDALIGANVLVKGTSTGTITDVDGKYSIEAASNAVLVFSYIGFIDTEIEVGNRSVIDIALSADVTQLNEIVVTAMGIEREAKELGYATQTVKGNDIEERQTLNVSEALVGRVSGLQVTQTDGLPGGTQRIVIRGGNNIGTDRSDQPLIIVDGVQIENDDVNISGSGRDWGSGLNDINPNDIENISVLKGANAAALYGARAANGVILITTKKGRAQKGIGISYNYTYLNDQVYKARDVQNEWGVGYTYYLPKDEAFPKDDDGNFKMPDVSFWGSGASWGPKMDGTEVIYYDGEKRPFEPQPDNLLEPYQDGQQQTHNIAFSGGSELGAYRASVSDMRSTSIYPNTHWDRFTMSFNGSLNLNSKVRSDMVLNYYNTDQKNTAIIGDNGNGFGKATLYNWARSERVQLRMDNYKNEDGSRNEDFNYGRDGNVLWNILEDNLQWDNERYIGSLAITWDILDWLNLRLQSGIDNENKEYTREFNPWDVEGLRGQYKKELYKRNIYNHKFLFTANKTITDDITLGGTFGGEIWNRYDYALKSPNYNGFANPWLFAIANNDGDLSNPSESTYEKEIQSLFGAVDFGYKDYLFLQVTGRNDWSSTLPASNNSYFYPSASASWVFSEMFDLNSSTAISLGKLRASYALSSTDDNPYQLLPTYGIGNWFGYSYASVPGTIPPSNLKPQKTNSLELGLDIAFWNDRLNIYTTYYDKTSEEQILSGPVANSSGFSEKRFNTGSVKNNGIEITLDATVVQAGDFRWRAILNWARNTGKVLNLDDEGGVDRLTMGGIWGANGPSIEARAGEPLNTIMGWDYIYDEETGQRLVDEDGWYHITHQRVPVGNATPDFIGGLINTFSWNGFTLNTVLDIKWGGDTWFGSYGTAIGFGQAPKTVEGRDAEHGGLAWTDDAGNDRNDGMINPGLVATDVIWNEETQEYDYNIIGENTTIFPARYYWIDRSSGWGAGYQTSPAVFENSWIRMAEISINYDFPKRWLENIFVQNLAIQVITRNPFYIYKTAPDNINPAGELNPGKASGIEFGSLPITRQYGLNLKVAF